MVFIVYPCRLYTSYKKLYKASTIYLIEGKYKKWLIVNLFHKFSTKNMGAISYSNARCIICCCNEHKIARQMIDITNGKYLVCF